MAKDSASNAQFQALLESDEIALPVAAIEVLLGVIKRSKAATMHGLDDELRHARDELLSYCLTEPKALSGRTAISLSSGSELFMRHVTRTFLEFSDFELCKEQLLARGENFARQSISSRDRIAAMGLAFVRDSAVVLVHGRSRVVTALLLKAAASGKNFSVVATECRPSCAGYAAARELAAADIPVTVVPDAGVAYYMERVDCVVVGAEGVMENGGVINKVGTLAAAACAKAFHKPFYVAAESFKFARLFPLNQQDMPETHSGASPLLETTPHAEALPPNVTAISPACDYTPPNYITLLFTDLGVLTPSAVSDELIRLYQ